MSREERGHEPQDHRSWQDGDEDPTARRLRAVLSREAARVEPAPDGLRRIQAAVAGGDEVGARKRRRSPWRPLLAAAAAAAVVGGGTGVVLGQWNDRGSLTASTASTASPTGTTAIVGGGGNGIGPEAGTPGTGTRGVGGPETGPAGPPVVLRSDPGSAASRTSEPSLAPGTARVVPVYWLGQSRTRVLLYREFVPSSRSGAEAAVRTMLGTVAGAPVDPDYSTPWRPAPVRVDVGPDVVTVDLGRQAFAGTAVGSEVAQVAVQQLVHTVTAAVAWGGKAGAPAPARVRVLVDGKAGYDAWGAVRLGQPMTRDPSAVAPNWIIDPAEGRRVAAGTIRVTGVGTAFEGTLAWEVAAGKGTSAPRKVVASGVTQAGSGPKPEPFAFTVALPPGTYTVTVFAPDMSDGESAEGPRQYPDSKTIVVV